MGAQSHGRSFGSEMATEEPGPFVLGGRLTEWKYAIPYVVAVGDDGWVSEELDELARPFGSPRDYLEAARAPSSSSDLLDALAQLPYNFVREAVAEHPSTRTQTLHALIPAELANWNDRALLVRIVRHRNADRTVFSTALTRVRGALDAGQRPYAVAIALAERGALTPDQAHELGTHTGASARLRHGLTKAIATHQPDQH